MKIAITHPFCFPYVRRGNERNIEELARYMTSRGHEVVTISTRPDEAVTEHTEYGKRILHTGRNGSSGWARILRLQAPHLFYFDCLQSLLDERVDVVHSWLFCDGLAAARARSCHHRTVLQINGVPAPGVSCHRWLPPEGYLYRKAARSADRTIACSRFIRDLARERYGIEPRVIPPPVNMDRYALGCGPPDGRPTILAVADFDVRRKGIRVFVRAFSLVAKKLRDVRLRVAGNISNAVKSEVLKDLPQSVAASIEFLGLQTSEEIARLYREASVMALPAMWEPSGTVLIEALSAGTPVVATNHAGIPEFVAADTGVLFDPKTDAEETHNADGLAEALLAGIELSRQDGIRERCREHAGRFSWSALGPAIEEVYGGK